MMLGNKGSIKRSNIIKFVTLLFVGFLLTISFMKVSSAQTTPPVYLSDKHSCDPGETPELVDSLTISGTEPDPVTVNLPDDGEYLFEANGTYTYYIGGGATADAAYANDGGNWGSILSIIGSYGSPYTGVTSLLSDMGGGTIGIVKWGDYNSSHTYGFLYDVISSDVQFVISDWYDTWYIWDFSSITNNQYAMEDDEGSLTLNIYKCNVTNGSNTDADGDGYYAEVDDCDDTDASIHPGALDDQCDGIDNNCSGEADEDYVNTPSSCGVGECSSDGEIICDNGSEVDTCTPGDPSTEVCDGLDNNCDGETDEDFPDLGNSCSAGVGICEQSGSYICSGDNLSTMCDASAGDPTTETCNGLDDDCDGSIDEDLTRDSEVTYGQCFGNTDYCDNGDWLPNESNYEPVAEICDGLDNNCDDQIDEDLNRQTSNQYGLCAGNEQYCSLGDWIDDSQNYIPVPEVCDGFDNNCDDQIDEDLFRPSSNIEGLCSGNTDICTDGNWDASGGNYDPVAEICDGLDNDCNGTVDDGNVCDLDNDGVPNAEDFCPDTSKDEFTQLGINRWVWFGNNWISTPPKGKGPSVDFTMTKTQGCSCSQILDILNSNNPKTFGDMKGLRKFGCTIGIMQEFIKLQSSSVFSAHNYFTIFVK